MSGGHFDYKQFACDDIIRELDVLRVQIEDGNENYEFIKEPKQVLAVIRRAIWYAEITKVYVHRLDRFLSGDDDEESLYERLGEELDNVKYASRPKVEEKEQWQ